MPTTEPAKNAECVKRSQTREKKALCKDVYNEINTDAKPRHRDKSKGKIG